jgi:hypothetical protein
MDQQTEAADYIDSIIEAQEMRGEIRAAADRGDYQEVRRMVQRIHDLELDQFARRYTEVRHARAQRGRLGGYNPQLEQVEQQLSAMLTKIGVAVPRDQWTHRG